MHDPAGYAVRAVRVASCTLLVLTLLAGYAVAQEAGALKGVALIIGQSRYTHITPLANPAQDARAVDGLLAALGFDTRSVTDRDGEKLKRDLDRFAEDAQGADVALLYYSGHGIEAGGENYLIPTDADPNSLADAGERLVPLSKIMDRLKQSVPVAILLLDACRTNPFPPNATVRIGEAGLPQPVATIGLGPPRGMSEAEEQASADNLGMVIGLAAEPGRAALDGDPGGNSPYAAALLRHLSAIKGEEFGTVMRMVTEEVYLTTKTRQRPWINESLRRLLYFGGIPQEMGGDSGLITQERRQLLLTIADLPNAGRKQVETIAEKDGVPLDALYGVLKALGATDIPKDPAELEKYLRAQAATLKEMAVLRGDIKPRDPLVVQLMESANRAVSEGAIATARGLLSKAVAIVEKNRNSGDASETRDADRIGDAALYERRAEVARLLSDFGAAARDYENAYALVAKLNNRLAWYYKVEGGIAVSEQSDRFGGMANLAQAIETLEAALNLISRQTAPEDWASNQVNLGNALQSLGDRDPDSDGLDRSIAAYRAALEVFSVDTNSVKRGMVQSNLGGSLMMLGQRQADTALLQEAEVAFTAALSALPRESVPLDWARAQNNLGNTLRILGERESGAERFKEAAAAYRSALEERRRDEMPLQWAITQSNLGTALRGIGEREGGTQALEQSVAAYHAALEELTPELAPLDWSTAQNNLGNALATLGQREQNIARFKEAAAAFRAALQQRSREQSPLLWAQTQNNLASALTLIGQQEGDATYLEQAATAFRAVLQVRTRDKLPFQWAQTQSNLGSVLQILGELKNDAKAMMEAIAAHRLALLVLTREQAPQEWSKVQNNLGNALRSLGEHEQGTALLRQAVTALKASLEERSREQSPHQWARTQTNLGLTLLALGRRGGGRKTADGAIAAFEAALAVYQEANATQNIAQVQGFLNEARALKR